MRGRWRGPRDPRSRVAATPPRVALGCVARLSARHTRKASPWWKHWGKRGRRDTTLRCAAPRRARHPSPRPVPSSAIRLVVVTGGCLKSVSLQ
ncbi:hypothetical protein BU14_0183s0017 [Porphyra umbilicalis]|uniref:Uncharacterized protein n=1 Tax=Porphyra umbilicalis TaxID=2786 RepID=A0A1X6P799_PORUM|nr:hypothetical protein BU14_0183s0017 [Porphyra umbilicalis]|eukprot:OSX76625.1 hypothetical protein BU14_0183s0017 [Porphyra umbilicalis]